MMSIRDLPKFVSGVVIKGFGRGSKELGCPTANFSQDVVNEHGNNLMTGVYFGWARVDDGEIHKMVMSVGWNPFYKNKHKSMETHIMHEFPSDFYGSTLRVLIVQYLRQEMDFKSLDDLISTIQSDIATASKELDKDECRQYRNSESLTKPLTIPNGVD